MNIKSILLVAAASITALSAMAIPARRGLHQISLPDGSSIEVRLFGDEHFHTMTTSDGLSISRGEDGFFYYQTPEGRSAVRAHDASLRSDAERQFTAARAGELAPAALAKTWARPAARRASSRAASARASQVPQMGSPRIPILLVQYRDKKFKDSDPAKTFKGFFNTNEKSALNYFKDQSAGQYTPQFDVYGPVTLNSNRATYGANDIWGYDVGVGIMVAEACQKLNDQIDFSKYDNDGDGECDVVICLYAGDGEASSYDSDAENAIWPCQWDLKTSEYGRDLNMDNTVISRFAVFNELNGLNLSKIDGVGTFCHEFSHCLDLPDFYDTDYGPHFGMGPWSLMDYGSYNDDGYTPIGYSAYEKAFMGWIQPQEAAPNTFFTLPVLNQKGDAQNDQAVKVTYDGDILGNEYYILENRAATGWDQFIPAEGLMITHVTYNAAIWNQNLVNNDDLQRMTLMPADGILKLNTYKYDYGYTAYDPDPESLKGDLWPFNGIDELTDESFPAATVNYTSQTLPGPNFMGKPITRITRNDDGTISFWTMRDPVVALPMPTVNDHILHSNTSFTASWNAPEGDNVAEHTYTLEIRPHSEISYTLVSSTSFADKTHTWTPGGFTEIDNAEKATRLGSGKQLGSLTSSPFRTDDSGIVTVKFRAHYYGTDNTEPKISLVDGAGNEYATTTVALTKSFADYVVTLQTTPNTSVAVCFATPALKKRFLLQSADVYTGDATEALAAPTRAPMSTTFKGLTALSHKIEDLEADGVYEYRLRAEPVDATSLDPSPWTPYTVVDLSKAPAAILLLPTSDASPAPARFYNLQGQPVANPGPGLYIRVTGSRAEKVLLR